MLPLTHLLQEEPIGSFAILLLIILAVPPLFERLRLPGVLGLLLAGVLLGPNLLNLLTADEPVMAFLADLGLLYLMFVAGLEIDLAQLRKVRNRSLSFGAFTFLCPLVAGIAIGRIFHFDWNGSVLLGSLLASHSLMTYPILRRLGVVTNEAVTVTIGATICTDIGALILLAVCLGVHDGGFSLARLTWLLLALALYTLVVLVGCDRVGQMFFRRSTSDEGSQFLFLLLAVFLAAMGAELIGVEKIVGAFLSGLAVNDVVGDSPVKEKVVFVGSVLFIPIFFVNIGLLIDLPAFLNSLQSLGLALTIVGGLMASKFLAALLAKLCFRYSWQEMLTMGSISIPQVATTLAATLVGNRAGILSDDVLNSVVVMMLVTATLGPLLVSRVAVGLPLPPSRAVTPNTLFVGELPRRDRPFTVIVPVYNPQTEQHLIELAALLAQQRQGQVVPLAIALARPHMTVDQLARSVRQSEALLAKAEALGQGLGMAVKPVLRVDDQVAMGIRRTSLEQQASLVVMGAGNTAGLRARLFGNIIDSVFWAAPCPVAVTRLSQSPRQIQRILVPVENFSERGYRVVAFARLLAEATQAGVGLLHICQSTLGPGGLTWADEQMTQLIQTVPFQTPVEQMIRPPGAIVEGILRAAKGFDLVILHSQRQQAAAEGFGFSSITSQVVQQWPGDSIVLGESHLGET
ncbi:MAG: cation:proton antiporter [Leptolyngbya sp.]|nr:cation:proton antiporter [Leptolyngbya sp.]